MQPECNQNATKMQPECNQNATRMQPELNKEYFTTHGHLSRRHKPVEGIILRKAIEKSELIIITDTFEKARLAITEFFVYNCD